MLGTSLLLKVKSAFVLLPVVLFLVLRFVSCLHHCSKLGTNAGKYPAANVAFGYSI